MSLCNFCAAISIAELVKTDNRTGLVHHATFFTLKSSADAGCPACYFFYTALENTLRRYNFMAKPDMADIDDRYLKYIFHIHTRWDRRLDHIVLGLKEEESQTYNTIESQIDLFVHPDDPAAEDDLIIGRPLPRTDGSHKEDFELIRSWLDTCIENHEECRKPVPGTQLPTRVIDVGSRENRIEPRLILSNGQKGRYVTLSHCWGNNMPLTTTNATLPERLQSIPLESMPKTFREAVIATRNLGIQYLWIDSLCILQDSEADWREQSAVMDQVYASSYLTIAARSSRNAEGGLFFARERDAPTCRLPYRTVEGEDPEFMFLRSPTYQHEKQVDVPLSRRGWVLQERILSPRVLYFGRQQLYWECTEQAYRQDGRDSVLAEGFLDERVNWKHDLQCGHHNRTHYDEAFRALDPQHPERIEFERDTKWKQGKQWYELVAVYTALNLTHPSDKLPALAGIAKDYQRKTGYTYLAGLWKEDLVPGMTWYRDGPSGQIVSPTLPSWTWARLSNRVRYISNPMTMQPTKNRCKVADLTYQHAKTHDFLGDMTQAELRIHGRLIEAVELAPLPLPPGIPHAVIIEGVRAGDVYFDTEPVDLQSGKSFPCLVLDIKDSRVYALALEHVIGAESETYRRIGFAYLYPEGANTDGISTPEWLVEMELPRTITLL